MSGTLVLVRHGQSEWNLKNLFTGWRDVDLSEQGRAEAAAAGQKLNAMLEMGMSKPWPDALEALTGTRQMDATAIIDYFAPLQAWLKEQNKGRECGWNAAATLK